MKKSEIRLIYRLYENGMYTDYYDVVYYSGRKIRYYINGEMNNKHAEFIMNSHCETRYKDNGLKVDIFKKELTT